MFLSAKLTHDKGETRIKYLNPSSVVVGIKQLAEIEGCPLSAISDVYFGSVEWHSWNFETLVEKGLIEKFIPVKGESYSYSFLQDFYGNKERFTLTEYGEVDAIGKQAIHLAEHFGTHDVDYWFILVGGTNLYGDFYQCVKIIK